MYDDEEVDIEKLESKSETPRLLGFSDGYVEFWLRVSLPTCLLVGKTPARKEDITTVPAGGEATSSSSSSSTSTHRTVQYQLTTTAASAKSMQL